MPRLSGLFFNSPLNPHVDPVFLFLRFQVGAGVFAAAPFALAQRRPGMVPEASADQQDRPPFPPFGGGRDTGVRLHPRRLMDLAAGPVMDPEPLSAVVVGGWCDPHGGRPFLSV